MQLRHWMTGSLVLAAAAASAPEAQGAFTYQGRLDQGGVPLTDVADFEFTLWDAAVGGAMIGGMQQFDGVPVVDGAFSVILDFGAGAFNAEARFLAISVRSPSGSGVFEDLFPRQPVHAAPQALYSLDTRGLAVDAAGNIGVGTSSPTTQMEIWGVSSTKGVLALVNETISSPSPHCNVAITGYGRNIEPGATDATGRMWYLGNSTSADRSVGLFNHNPDLLRLGTDNSTDMVIDAAGRVGVNTTTPIGTFEISAIGDEPCILTRGLRDIAVPAGESLSIGQWNADNSTFTARLHFDTSGRAGIGTTAPAAQLHVAGTSILGAGAPQSGYINTFNGDTTIQRDSFAFLDLDADSGTWRDAARAEWNGLWYSVYGLTSFARPLFRATYDSGSPFDSNATEFQVQDPSGDWQVRFLITDEPPVGYVGTLEADVLTVAGKFFKIDHPLDPENKYLYHSCVESPDMKNIYDGVVTTDAAGYATVTLPEYFDALNGDFRYQLTVIDASDDDDFLLAKIAQEIQDNQFRIRSSAPHTRVSWQVTGNRKDAFATAMPAKVEVEKQGAERGRYLHPQAFGKSAEWGVNAIDRPGLEGPE